MSKPTDTKHLRYHPPRSRFARTPEQSVDPIGIDTEADVDGKMFMTCLSDGTVLTRDEWPAKLFTRKYRDKTYVAYNLKYDAGALLQHLSAEELNILRADGRVTVGEYVYRVIANKLLSIRKKSHYVTIFDIMQFYGGSLDRNAERYLGENKLDIETKRFTEDYINEHWDEIAEYCVRDADLTRRLAKRFIDQLNEWDMHVTKLYSTAWISYQWFASRAGHPSVKQFWLYDREVLDYAMRAYNGGKFEMTTKGAGYLYEYDIVSAYPTTISQLYDLYHCGVKWSKTYVSDAPYAFIKCHLNIPLSLPSPVAVKRGTLNTYPAGEFTKTITKQEYDYLTAHGADITIVDACWIVPDRPEKLYEREVNHIVGIKQQHKHGDPLAYHTAKIILNSLYGKFVQLIEQTNGQWRASSSWNPIYGSVITAETRVRISDLQRRHPSVWAVHTDSIISSEPLPYGESKQLGDLSYELEGEGAIVGCGVYEIGDRTAIRGVPAINSLRSLFNIDSKYADVSRNQPLSWRQTMHRNLSVDEINRWREQAKRLRVDMDTKRIWLDDWDVWSDVPNRVVASAPYTYDTLWYGSTD